MFQNKDKYLLGICQYGYDPFCVSLLTDRHLKVHSKMPTVRNARSLVTSRELPSGLQIWGKRPAECIVLSGYNEG